MKIIIYNIGEYGPVGLFIASCFLLWNKKNLIYYYTVGTILNCILNLLLKVSFQQPRPSDDVDKFNLAITKGRKHLFTMVPFNIYGMPSGHSQSVMFSTVYVFLSLQNTNISLFYLSIALITMWQRVNYNFHTIMQVLVGCVVGGLFAHGIFQLAKGNIIGLIEAKPDDNAPY